MRRFLSLLLFSLLAVGALLGCQPAQPGVDEYVDYEPLPTITPIKIILDETRSVDGQIDRNPNIVVKDEPELDPLILLNCGETFCSAVWTGWLERPFSRNYTRTIDFSYPFASIGDGTLDPHHGVEFPNKFGVPVLAAQNGEVVYAGTDENTKLGSFWNFYGNVVILKHSKLVNDLRDVYTIYAHLSEISVKVGQHLSLGDQLGKVGSSGAAIGQHLHFEVRLDKNEYDHTINPMTMFAPLNEPGQEERATLAGVILDPYGEPIPKLQLTLEKLTQNDEIEKRYYPETYTLMKLEVQSLIGENFAIPDLPSGRYRLSFVAGGLNHFELMLEPGDLGFFTFQQQPNVNNTINIDED